jgi:O-antigen ligase
VGPAVRDLSALTDSAVRWGLVGLIAFTPLAFGTVEPWSIALMEWGIVTLALLFCLGRVWGARRWADPPPGRTGLELPIVLFIVFCAAQTIPLPVRWVVALSPAAARQYRSVDFQRWMVTDGAPEVASADADPITAIEPPSRRPLSVHADKTFARTLLLGVFALLFFLVVKWCDRESRILFLLKSLTVVGSLVAAFGLVQHLTWNGRIYWVRKVPPASSFGPFVNHNHFAGYVEMIIPVAIAFVLYHLEGRRPRGAAEDEGRWGKAGLTLFAAVILVVSLVLCMSRGGILSMLVSGIVLIALAWRRIQSRGVRWSIVLAVPLLATMMLLWIGGEAVAKGIGSYRTISGEASFQLRVMVWERMARHLPDVLWVGSGLGTFEESFAPIILPGSSVRWDRAHNDYLQLLWETGLVGAALFLAGGGIFARRYWWPALRSSVHSLDLFRLGTAVALLSLSLHSIVDFNLQIGANGFLFVLLAAILVSLDRVTMAARDERPVLLEAPARQAANGIAGHGRGSYI